MGSKKAVKQLKAIEKLLVGKEMRLAAEWNKKWHVLISTILSAQTKDETTIDVCEILFKKYKSPRDLGNARLSSIERIIRRVNYHKTKARHIKKTCQMIAGKKIPDNIERLLMFPGVGRKVANVYLAVAHKADAIGVDTHVGRISYKMGWTKNKNPHHIEKDLEKLFPKKYWRSINYILVRFGRDVGRNRAKEDKVLESLKN